MQPQSDGRIIQQRTSRHYLGSEQDICRCPADEMISKRELEVPEPNQQFQATTKRRRPTLRTRPLFDGLAGAHIDSMRSRPVSQKGPGKSSARERKIHFVMRSDAPRLRMRGCLPDSPRVRLGKRDAPSSSSFCGAHTASCASLVFLSCAPCVFLCAFLACHSDQVYNQNSRKRSATETNLHVLHDV